ncbi:MAG: tyrosine-protein phosphatase [Clostridia bacterium]|nr:tyrosine-protein phosphatase [Clostridia bacterium]
MIKKLLCFILAAFTAFALVGCEDIADEASDNAGEGEKDKEITLAISEIKKHGNVVLNATFEDMRIFGIEVGDIITVYVGDKTYSMPVGTSYTDVDGGEMMCRFDVEDNEIALAVNYGSFAEITGVAVKEEIEENPGYKWIIAYSELKIELKEKGGYLDEYKLRNLTRSNERSDYNSLTDEEFANFRAITVGGIKANAIYRSSTPIDDAIGRNAYAMAAMQKAGIRSVVNLTDSAEEMKNYEAFADSYYSGCDIINVEMSYDFESEVFSGKIKKCFEFIAESEGPFLIHCKEGKDRTGVLCAVIECFAGATVEEIKQDYMLTYLNFYGINKGDAVYDTIYKRNLEKVLCGLFGVDELKDDVLKDKANEYLISTGLTKDLIAAFYEKIVK